MASYIFSFAYKAHCAVGAFVFDKQIKEYNMPIDQLNFEEVSRHTFHFKGLILCFERLVNFGLYSMVLCVLSFLNIDYHMYNHSIRYIYILSLLLWVTIVT